MTPTVNSPKTSSVRLSFVAARAFSSRLIEWFGGGGFSHVDAMLPDGRLLGARSDVIGVIPPGVQIRSADYEKWPKRLLLEIPCTVEQSKDFHGFLQGECGKPYDRLAIVGFAINRNWRDEDSWFCSELVTRALEVAGICPDLRLTPNRITPGACALIACALGGRLFTLPAT